MGPLTRLRLFVAAHPLLAALAALVSVYLVVEHRPIVVGAGVAAGLLVLGALVARAASARSGWAGPAAPIRTPDAPPAASWVCDPDVRRMAPAPVVAPAPPAGGPILIQVGAVSILVPPTPGGPVVAEAPVPISLGPVLVREPATALPSRAREVGDA